jgi:hypothetical protein
MSGQSNVDDNVAAATTKATAPTANSKPVTRRSPSPSPVVFMANPSHLRAEVLASSDVMSCWLPWRTR